MNYLFILNPRLLCIFCLFIRTLPILVGNCLLSFESLYFCCISSFYWSCLHSRTPQFISIWSKLKRARYFLFFFDSELFYNPFQPISELHCCQLKETAVWGVACIQKRYNVGIFHFKFLEFISKFSMFEAENCISNQVLCRTLWNLGLKYLEKLIILTKQSKVCVKIRADFNANFALFSQNN